MQIVQDGVNVTTNTDTITKEEIQAYLERGRSKSKVKLTGCTIVIDGDMVDLQFEYDKAPFQRIRRITGYLVGTLDRFNNGKRAEVEDRVTHSLTDDCEDVYVDEPLTASA